MNKYFIKREVVGDYNNYWGSSVDPDGNSRNMSSFLEWESYKKDKKQEIDFINSLPGGRIIDVGCGCGHFLNSIGSQWTSIYGVDIVDVYKSRGDVKPLIYTRELVNIGFSSGFFDAVILYHVIEHVKDPVSLIKEIRRILKDNGVLLLGTPNFGSWVARRFGNNFRLLHDKTHICLFDKDSMVYFLEDHGFIIEDIKYPFFRTEYFTLKNLLRLFDTSKVSPPFYGNIMTFYCRKGG
jgi:2-polyprenyl-3-methyl-5-hydroxy-6-metoxy-1,4-benzoquinol methylase